VRVVELERSDEVEVAEETEDECWCEEAPPLVPRRRGLLGELGREGKVKLGVTGRGGSLKAFSPAKDVGGEVLAEESDSVDENASDCE
jgi:hypothetical protein